MAFHVACPITCRRICFCSLGFSRSLQSVKAKDEFVEQIVKLEEFLQDPWGIRVADKDRTVQVLVPKVTPPPPQPQLSIQQTQIQLQLQHGIDEGGGGTAGGDGVEEISAAAAAASAQTKRVALQKKAAAAMVAAEDFARRFEAGDLPDAPRSRNGEEQGQSNVNVMCRMCFFGENEGSDKAKKMLSCKSCGKKYHRSCLKSWAQNRDLFHWSSWTCPSCRTCEVCRRTGDPNKFMFCKRCDAASHCYCQQPPHKNVSSGPYLCPKHTRCHSCGSNVPGNGLSVRWFLGYTCCDACGRLFVKGNYCPVCLKVYRDSESTPMVCCDVCQRWVHCQCDGISDEKYLQFQVDGNLQYKCATCRGECYQVKDLEDAVRELWRRRDITDRDLIASLRAAAGLPTQEDIFSISPYSDDEDCWPTRNEHGRSFKFSLKGLVDKSPKKTKDQGKKSSIKKNVRKKEYEAPITSAVDPHQSFEEDGDIKYSHSLGDDKIDDGQSSRNELSVISSSHVAGVLNNTEEGFCFTNRPGALKHKLVNDVMVKNEDRWPRVVRIKRSQSHGLDSEEEIATPVNKSKTVKGKKLVINFGPRKINAANSPRSDTSSCHRDQDIVTPNGSEDISQRRVGDNLDRHGSTDKSRDSKGDDVYTSGQSKGVKVAGREGNLIKLGKVRSDAPDSNTDSRKRNAADGNGASSLEHPRILFGRRRNEGKTDPAGPDVVPEIRSERTSVREQSERRSDVHNAANSKSNLAPFSNYTPKDSKPLLKFKFKKPSIGNQNSINPEEEKSSIKGQRSKRKRPSPLMDKASFIDDEEATNSHQAILMDDIMDAKILKKLGRDAIGKRVEVHQPSDNSWHKGEVTNVAEGTSKLYVTLDDGKIKSLELGKQGVRFGPQKHKRSRT